MEICNKLTIIGNGFDLAHGLKTSYKNFLDWYMCKSFAQFCKDRHYTDTLITISNKYGQYGGMYSNFVQTPLSFEDVLSLVRTNDLQFIK